MLRRGTYVHDHLSLKLSPKSFSAQSDLKNPISKTEESISGVAAMVKEIQDYREHFCK